MQDRAAQRRQVEYAEVGAAGIGRQKKHQAKNDPAFEDVSAARFEAFGWIAAVLAKTPRQRHQCQNTEAEVEGSDRLVRSRDGDLIGVPIGMALLKILQNPGGRPSDFFAAATAFGIVLPTGLDPSIGSARRRPGYCLTGSSSCRACRWRRPSVEGIAGTIARADPASRWGNRVGQNICCDGDQHHQGRRPPLPAPCEIGRKSGAWP